VKKSASRTSGSQFFELVAFGSFYRFKETGVQVLSLARILVWSKIVTQSIIIEVKIRYKSMVDVHGNIIDVWGDCVVRL